MDEKCIEKLTLLATSIAIELTKSKTLTEINELKFILYQIYSTLCTISGITSIVLK